MSGLVRIQIKDGLVRVAHNLERRVSKLVRPEKVDVGSSQDMEIKRRSERNSLAGEGTRRNWS